VGFELTIAAGERPKANALDRAATGTGMLVQIINNELRYPLASIYGVISQKAKKCMFLGVKN
jgi:hypothetical protein